MTQIYDPTRDLLGPATPVARDPMTDGFYAGDAGKTVEDIKAQATADAVDEDGPCGDDCECFEQDGTPKNEAPMASVESLGAILGVLSGLAKAKAEAHRLAKNPIIGEAQKFVRDLDAALTAVIDGRATSVLIERTIRDQNNQSRKLLVSFQVDVEKVGDFEDADPTDGFRINTSEADLD